MPTRWLHGKVWVAWGRYWAIQWQGVFDEAALGARVNWRRPLVDLYLGPLTIGLGWHPEWTPRQDAQRSSCRGFFVTETPVL